MLWLIDGSNLLGTAGHEREGVEEKRAIVRRLAQFGRQRNHRILCYFDGAMPESFATSLGHVRVEFTHPVRADERIVAAAERRQGESLVIVTSDRQLADRVRSRRVRLVSSRELAAMLAASEERGEGADTTDWEAYFSNPQNRSPF